MKQLFLTYCLLSVIFIQSQELKTNLLPSPELTENILILKGKIIDSETNESIPYCNLIIKNEEIYRVADDNGNFSLSISPKQLNTASVNVSSMGYDSRTIQLKDLTSSVKLTPKYEELDEIVITSYLQPKTILKKAINLIDTNHPTDIHNYDRYGQVVINKNDQTLLDIELITKDCDQGYDSPFVISQRVEQVKWNKNIQKNKYNLSSQFFSYRQNAIRYATVLHKRKYKEFDLKFIKSSQPDDEGLYIIEFKTVNNKWNYTNRIYPTQYAGKIYINKDNLAIIKVIENWETTLDKLEIQTYLKENKNFENWKKIIIKEENICTYSKNINNKYYATNYFNRRYTERLNNDGKIEHSVYEANSKLYNHKTKDVEDIEYYEYNNKKENSLYRVEYNLEFWDSFYKFHFNQKNKL